MGSVRSARVAGNWEVGYPAAICPAPLRHHIMERKACIDTPCYHTQPSHSPFQPAAPLAPWPRATCPCVGSAAATMDRRFGRAVCIARCGAILPLTAAAILAVVERIDVG